MNLTSPEVVVCAEDAASEILARQVADHAGLLLVNAGAATDRWRLLVKQDTLVLTRPDGLSTQIDFLRGKATQRSQEANFKSQPLARALGLPKLRKRNNATPNIIDATAGFGTDAWMMASLGSKVRLIEASPVLCAMLSHAISKTGQDMHVVNTNSVSYLLDNDNAAADIVYLDPMYPQTRSKALVKKGMQLLHELIGPDDNSDTLLNAALSKADYRVVVKRPRGAPRLAGSEQYTGQITDVQSAQTRFDVYHIEGSQVNP